jgi:hypothetical protein
MDIDTGAQQGSRYPSARFDEKRCLQVWGGDVLKGNSCRFTTPRGQFFVVTTSKGMPRFSTDAGLYPKLSPAQHLSVLSLANF